MNVKTDRSGAGRSPPRFGIGEFGWIWIALLGLVAVCALVAPSALKPGSIQSMLPLFSVLLLLAAGQTLIVQQRGIDMSVGALATLSGLFVAVFTGATGSGLGGVVCALALCGAFGAVNGLLTTRLNISPIVATLATGTLMAGIARLMSGGSAMPIPPGLQDIARARLAGVPGIGILAIVIVLAAWFVIRRTTHGRRFVATGANPATARASGTRVELIQVGTYAVAGVFYGVGGFLLAGYIGYATPTAGTSYLLPSIAVVVIGGTPFTGGRGSLVATIGAAAFMTLLDQMVLSMGARMSEQLLTQAAAIVVATSIRRFSLSSIRGRIGRGKR
ncbi:ABC transporter permease [Ruixingdingia sedimenti]|uniref:Autoinducer 2 import system permease protein LsrD n=1 Tax=Ruixingdingia sedimenti TaxID=3073604 RepID=A0ABU1FB11_9RHOB|nr:ABC transporter permease [Xinfangfangia sp. LG-4]MDR5654076.1 ABC transporter permease [Xinfangfangia sp. LG-4]